MVFSKKAPLFFSCVWQCFIHPRFLIVRIRVEQLRQVSGAFVANTSEDQMPKAGRFCLSWCSAPHPERKVEVEEAHHARRHQSE